MESPKMDEEATTNILNNRSYTCEGVGRIMVSPFDKNVFDSNIGELLGDDDECVVS